MYLFWPIFLTFLFPLCFAQRTVKAAVVDLLASQRSHVSSILSTKQTRDIAALSDTVRLMTILHPIALPRVAGTPQNARVRQFITDSLARLGYKIELDEFTPVGIPRSYKRSVPKMTNIIATLNPRAPRRLVLACHYDSKFDAKDVLIGASDSAVPCAMMIDSLIEDLAAALHTRISTRWQKSDLTLQLIFFDGEEAFVKCSAVDSLYGARNLADKFYNTSNQFDTSANLTALNSMDIIVLLDLIGPLDVQFRNFYYNSAANFHKMVAIEKTLEGLKLIKSWGRKTPYFEVEPLPAGTWVDDDCRPFLAKGVRTLHMISTPFPSVWHKPGDTLANVHVPTVEDIGKILRVYVCEYLGCSF